MQLERIHIQRIQKFISRLKPQIYSERLPLQAEYLGNHDKPIPYSEIGKFQFKEIAIGVNWGKPWDSTWFRFSAVVPDSLIGKEIGAWVDTDGESCVWKNGSPWQGLTNKQDSYHNAGKYFIPLAKSAIAGERVEIIVEAAANGMFGKDKNDYKLVEAALVSYNPHIFDIWLNMDLLINLALHLPVHTVRRQKILFGLNAICNVWQEGKGIGQAANLIHKLKSQPAHASALTAYSVGHAHIDLAWLWPIRETKRKSGRTFSTALRMIENYPCYIFGASQAQLYKWTKELYPTLYNEIKAAVKNGRWEVQGAGWVEFDTNLTGGEAIIRQLFYGKRFFQEEFGISPDVLWLPDCFGFNGNLPQLMKGCDVEYFTTQKLSWNESDTFPYHNFIWQGIDGSEVIAHQQPTNDYCFSNSPQDFLETETRFTQSDAFDEFLNLYGIGDGGGGPGREHIEYALCQENLEGVSKVKFSPARDFFEKLASYDREFFPVWFGELYLQYHRGTYTTHALMKKHNRMSELLLHDAEMLAALTGKEYPTALQPIWEDIMLMQFHDIIPGTSITWVYDDAKAMSESNHQLLKTLIQEKLQILAKGETVVEDVPQAYLLLNTQSWDRNETIRIPTASGTVWLKAFVPAYGYSIVPMPAKQTAIPQSFQGILENEFLRVTLSPQATITSIYDKETGREILEAPSNVLKLWEHIPNKWSWDIQHFYRETEPLLAAEVTLEAEQSYIIPDVIASATYRILIGNSIIYQTISLVNGERSICFAHEVDWKENLQMLRVHFYPNIHSTEATYEIQFGAVKRTTRPNTSWEKAQFEVPAHRFADLSEPDYGAALINDCKYGYRVEGNELELTLLCSPTAMDAQADLHMHTYNYMFYPHQGCFEQSDVVQTAHCFNSPLLVLPVSADRCGESFSYFSILGDRVKLETVKPCETGEGVILRLYEYTGSKAKVELKILIPCTTIYQVSMTEKFDASQPSQKVDKRQDGSYLALEFKPFEIKTLLIR
jgi:alpha-mannosidase